MLVKVEGIVIRSIDYGESNKILTLYTRESGKIGVMARGAKKANSRLSSVSQLFTYGQYLFQKSSGLGSLSQGEMISSFRGIREDIFRTAYAAYVVELLDKLTEEKTPNPYLFELVYQVLYFMHEEIDPEILTFIFEVKMLSAAGIAPEFNKCANCGTMEGQFVFSIREGGFLCHKCQHIDPHHLKISSSTAKLLRLFYHFDITRLGQVSVKEQTKAEIKQILTTYYDTYSGLKLKSKRFLDQLDQFKID
ncbi:DNA repair protein RecO [Bacillus taeanensis]|uniref:DNA repair protein RecO n=1 Tax=Bacillus taeanensis TaxID=273032 RepID=A0A366Y292_9BACI|nr:DNA repair protein RecO [Bacillus taeanensis]RBW70514.1 DNA repair protein RecO [Bacillus taeanensis]